MFAPLLLWMGPFVAQNPPPTPTPTKQDSPPSGDEVQSSVGEGFRTHNHAHGEGHGDSEHELGLVLDGFLEQSYISGPDPNPDLELRFVELNGAYSFGDFGRAYGVVVSEFGELELDEAAFEFQQLPWQSETSKDQLTAGAFFLDFGTQMQQHVHELSTFQRPGVLEAYLGFESQGTGLEIARSDELGSSSRWRSSLGLFGSLDLGHGHGDEDDDHGPEAEVSLRDRYDALDDLFLNARFATLTRTDAGNHVQAGISVLHAPEVGFALDDSTHSVRGLSNTTVGLDLQWQQQRDAKGRGWTIGGEALWKTGAVGAEVDDFLLVGDPTDDRVVPFNGDVLGGFALAEYQWSELDTVRLLVGAYELPEPGTPVAKELELHWTRTVADGHFVRVGTSLLDTEHEDVIQFAIQYDIILGSHSHSSPW